MYGFDDCDTCCNGTSVMTGYNSLNDTSSGMVSPSSCDVASTNQAGQYDPNTVNPPTIGGGGGDGGGGGIGPSCTDYYWVYYYCYDDGWCEEYYREYAGCW